jgi:hypothetical protein
LQHSLPNLREPLDDRSGRLNAQQAPETRRRCVTLKPGTGPDEHGENDVVSALRAKMPVMNVRMPNKVLGL